MKKTLCEFLRELVDGGKGIKYIIYSLLMLICL